MDRLTRAIQPECVLEQAFYFVRRKQLAFLCPTAARRAAPSDVVDTANPDARLDGRNREAGSLWHGHKAAKRH